MKQLDNEFDIISRSLCRVGKITKKIITGAEPENFSIDFKNSNEETIGCK